MIIIITSIRTCMPVTTWLSCSTALWVPLTMPVYDTSKQSYT